LLVDDRKPPAASGISESAKRVGDAYLEAIRNLWPNDCDARPPMTSWRKAQQWLDRGVEEIALIEFIRDRLAGMAERKRQPPGSPGYLDKGVQELLDRKSASNPVADVAEDFYKPQEYTRKMAVSDAVAFVFLDMWPSDLRHCGTNPRYQPKQCKLPPDLLAWCSEEGPMPIDCKPDWQRFAQQRPDVERDVLDTRRRNAEIRNRNNSHAERVPPN
jgi:hypothetical protein